MKRNLIAATMAAASFAAPAWAQQSAHEQHHAHSAQQALAQPGGSMMGGSMMGGHSSLGLSDDQRARITGIQRELADKQREPTAKLRGAQLRLHDVFVPGSADEATARKAYDELSAARKELFEAALETHMRIAAVLTEEQRTQLRSASPCMLGESQL